jgi:hypothetical protein
VDGWVDGWMEVKVLLRIAYSTQKIFEFSEYLIDNLVWLDINKATI